MRTHFKPVVCWWCEFRSAEQRDVFEHALVNHPKSVGGRRKIACPHCDKAFTRPDNMLRHLKKERGRPVGTG